MTQNMHTKEYKISLTFHFLLLFSHSLRLLANFWILAPGSSVHGISQAGLEWVAISFSRGCSRPRD